MSQTNAQLLGSLFLVALFGATAGCSDPTENGDEATPLACAQAAPLAVRECISAFSSAVTDCYAGAGAPCAADDASLAAALAKLETEVTASCADGEFLSLSTDAVVGRLRNACSSEASSLAWRTYGGPQGAVWPSVGASEQECLAAAHVAVTTMVEDMLEATTSCLSSDDCDAAALASTRSDLVSTAETAVDGACDDLAALVAVDVRQYVERASRQVDCIAATSHADTGSLQLSCGPSNAEFEPTRGEYVRVVVDGEKWGTLCGDGSDYAFYVRLAPEGERLDRMVIGLQGGGVCVFEDDCTARLAGSADLFTAIDDVPPEFGIGSSNPEISPLASWTKVYLPYCNQDVFAGGGVTEKLGDLDLPRYGAVNIRAAVQMLRDVVWKAMDAEGGAGFRPDEVIALFGGWSAGAYGTLYNYHWFLDDLQWPRTAAFPDAGLALDNGEGLGVKTLGLLKIPLWGAQPNLPPYCFAGNCAVGPVLYEAISPRLKQVPEQQMLMLSNPVDRTQQGDAYFSDEAKWINTMRQSYCDTKDLPGINYYFTSVTDVSTHVVSLRHELWTGEVDGESMRDWFLRAVTEPDTLKSRVEEGDFVAAVPGVEPYPCEVAP